MKMLQYLFIFSCFFVLSSIMTVDAQQTCTDPATGRPIACPPTAVPEQPSSPDIPDADGDGTPDVRDECPNEGGPDWNQGCPVGPDADGDGTSDENDQCPNQGGPDWNQGCPTNDSVPTNQNLPPLPQFPPDPWGMDENGGFLPCLVATNGYTPVNMREEAGTEFPIVDILDPFAPRIGSYRYVFIRGISSTEVWYQISGGFVSAEVTRLSPQCDVHMGTWTFDFRPYGMAVVVEGLEISGINSPTVLEQISVVLICPGFSTVLLPTDPLTDCSGNGVSPAPNGERFLCDDTWVEAYEDCTFFSFPAVLIDASAQMMTLSIAPPPVLAEAGSSAPENEEQITLLFGTAQSLTDMTYNTETDHPPDPGAEGLFVVLLVGDVPDVNLVGFNPQPEPPAINSNFGLLIGSNIPDINIVGFNPQPEPPAIVTNFGQFSLNPTENGYQVINAEGVGVEITPVDVNLISINDLTLWPFPNMPDMTMWLVEGEDGESTTIMCPGSEVSFNPQPEPPALDACFSVTPVG